jgi:DUF4097 and DUF4098 domain-containing protein YvlB
MNLKAIIAFVIVCNVRPLFADDFHKKYEIPAGGQIIIGNSIGNIKISGYDGKDVEVIAYKKGADKEFIEVQDNSFGNRVEIFPKYLQFGRGNASIDFEVHVPKAIEYNLLPSSFSGKIEISQVVGRIMAKSVRGDVELKDIRGFIIASSLSGNVNAFLNQALQRSNLRLSSTSGSISVQAPASFQALIDISTANGGLKTNFPIEVQEMTYGPGKSAHAKLGAGASILHIRSIYGNISLLHK